jgi:hypothetical protein
MSEAGNNAMTNYAPEPLNAEPIDPAARPLRQMLDALIHTGRNFPAADD